MKLLITGASGFLGRRAAAYFAGLGYEVMTPAHKELDITEETSVRDWFRENRPEAVIHTAAISDTGLCQQKPEWSEKINVDGCVNLAKSCRETGAKLVICSSDQVYFGAAQPGPHRETEEVLQTNVYGRQKYRAEQRCLEIWPDTVCLRLSWMYSTQPQPGDHGHFLTTLLDTLRDETRPITWPVHDRRSITNVDTVIRNLPGALKLPGGAYNFGGENDTDTYSLVRSLLEELDLSQALARMVPNETAFADVPRDMTMDLTKTRMGGLDFPTTRQGLLDALKECLDL